LLGQVRAEQGKEAAKAVSKQKTGQPAPKNAAQIQRQQPHTIMGGLCNGLDMGCVTLPKSCEM